MFNDTLILSSVNSADKGEDASSNAQKLCDCGIMHQSFETTAPSPGEGREIAVQMCCVFTFSLFLQCREMPRGVDMPIGKHGSPM